MKKYRNLIRMFLLSISIGTLLLAMVVNWKSMYQPRAKITRSQVMQAGLRELDAQSQLLLLQTFLHKMDSLKQDSTTRPVYDSFLRAHPGLIDSALQALHYYLARYNQ